MREAPRISVAVPLFNEEATIPELLRRVRTVLDGLDGGPHEIVCVDDGSTDGTRGALEEAARADRRLVLVTLSRNFGHQAAVTAALDFVGGDVTIVMDADLQDPPEAIPVLLERYREGFDVVSATRARRPEGWMLRLAYFAFYRVLAAIADPAPALDAGDFALMSSQVVAELRRTREFHRYLRGLRTWVGFRQCTVPVFREARFAGASKYTVRKLIRLALDGMFAFSTVPLRVAVLVGAVAIGLSGAFGLYALYAKLILHRSPQGFTALILTVVFLAGVNLFFLGVIGEYIGRIYEQVKERPVYVVASVLRASRAESPPGPGSGSGA